MITFALNKPRGKGRRPITFRFQIAVTLLISFVACILAAPASAAPSLEISAPSVAVTNTTPVSFTLNYFNFEEINIRRTSITVHSTGTAVSGSFTIDGQGSSRVVTLSEISGNGTLAISIAAGTAVDGNKQEAPAVGPSQTVTVDNIPPGANLMSSNSPSRGGTLDYHVFYEEGNSISLDADDVIVGTTGSVTWTGVSIQEAWTARVIQVTGVRGEGTLNISLKAGTASDGANEVPFVGPTADVLIDSDPPVATIEAPAASGVRGGAVFFDVSFSGHKLVKLKPADIIINKTGTADASLFMITGEGDSRHVILNNISGEGSLGISIGAGSAIDDLGVAAAAGPSATIAVDPTVPFVNIFPAVASSRGGTVSFLLSYQGHTSVSLKAEDVEVKTTGSVIYTGVSVLLRSSIWNVDVNGVSGTGTLNIAVKAGTASDIVGSAGPAEGFLPVQIEPSEPTITVGAPSASLTNSGPVTFAVDYIGHSDILLAPGYVILNKTGTANATVSVSGSGGSRTVTLGEVTGNGTLGISIAAGSASNSFGLAAAVGPSLTVKVDNTPPTITLEAMPEITR